MMKYVTYILLIPVVFAISCAKQGMPPGGPVDKVPPVLLLTVPETGDTLVDKDIQIEAWFSEGINSASATEAIFITPYPGDDVEVKWAARRVRILFPEPLKPDRTYVVTFGTGIKDYRNNPLESSYILAFSTGDVLDQGEITGRVYTDTDASGIGVWAYPLSDSLLYDPTRVSPEYIVQCDKNGSFRFSHIAPGEYRLVAVRDRLADRLYQAVEDEVGLTTQDVRLDRQGVIRIDSLTFRMSVEDTVGPSLVRCLAQSSGMIKLSLDEPVSPYRRLEPRDVYIVAESDSTDTLHVNQIYPDPINTQLLHLFTESMQAEKQYVLIAKSLEDAAGNGVDPEYGRTTFTGTVRPDTTHPQLLLTDPAPGANLVELAMRLRLVFNEAMDSTRFVSGFSLTDTSGVVIPGEQTWPSPLEFIFQPSDSLESLTPYLVSLHDSLACDLNGNALMDTVFQFKTLNADTLSEIAGVVYDMDPEGMGNIVIKARQVGKEDIAYSQVLTDPSAYRLTDVLPGSYVIELFRDSDGNGRYSYGKPFPFKPAERFIVYEDTVAVRSRWPNEGNEIVLK